MVRNQACPSQFSRYFMWGFSVYSALSLEMVWSQKNYGQAYWKNDQQNQKVGPG